MDHTFIKNAFIESFHASPVLFSSPGRINLIGEHTDYNEGFVLPAAIDKEAVFAIAPNTDQRFRFFALDLNLHYETNEIKVAPDQFHWANYLLGVIAQFEKKGVRLLGIDCVFGSDIPVGAGLSSSAALECGFAYGLNEIFKSGFTKHELVLMAQKAEHEYAGVMCGIMDQFASMFGEEEHVIKLDCRDYSHQLFPFLTDDFSIVLCDTNVKHSLASSEYNARRKECEEGVTVLKAFDPGITALRDVSIDFIDQHKASLNPVVYWRCKYVIEENDRVESACNMLSNNNFKGLGELMYKSHEGLKNHYAVSCDELDILVDATTDLDYVAGARMMGGGFGGCTINLVKTDHLEIFKNKLAGHYKKRTGRDLTFYTVCINSGTKSIS